MIESSDLPLDAGATCSPTAPHPEVTAAMVDAGLQVLYESGLVAVEMSGDYLVVRKILDAALAARQFDT